ncbi:MAG: hypothetical protein ACYCW6_20915, partial [Candidatus Xenobia bacterium]
CSPELAARHLKRVHCGLLSKAISSEVPAAALLRLLPALSELQGNASWRNAPLDLIVENLLEQPLQVSLSTGAQIKLDLEPLGRKVDTVRLRSRRFEYLGITTDWMMPSGRRGRITRHHVNTLCGMAEVLLKLGRDGVPQAPRSMVLGNWLKMPREVLVTPRAVSAAA